MRLFRFKIRNRKFMLNTGIGHLLVLFGTLTITVILIHDFLNYFAIPSKSKNIQSCEATWTRISDSIYTFSAWLDMRNSGNDNYIPIRIIGLFKLPSKSLFLSHHPISWYRIKNEFPLHGYSCKLFYEGIDNKLTSISGQSLTRKIFEEGLKVYAGTFFNCYIPRDSARSIIDMNQTVLKVSIYNQRQLNYPSKLIPVGILRNTPMSSRKTLSICHRPLFGPMDSIKIIRQFLDYYEIMGISEFHFYDFGVSPSVKDFLERNRQRSIVVLHQWNLPTGNWDELWDYGSLAALTDCIYRSQDKRWIIVIDLDEIMVPQKPLGVLSSQMTLQTLLLNPKLEKFSQLLVRSAFFCEEFCSISTKATSHGLDIFRCLNRTKRIWPVGLRPKLIINPQKTLQIGHHSVTQFVDRSFFDLSSFKSGSDNSKGYLTSYVFPPTTLLLNHYRRNCSSISSKVESIMDREIVEDRAILNYKSKLEA